MSSYKDRAFKGSEDKYNELKNKSTTLYVGNLSFYTREQQIWEIARRCGDVKRIVLGLNRETRYPCGFCFVEFFVREDAEEFENLVNGSYIDSRQVRVDFDAGFEEGRQYGRGRAGGQVRDDYRTSYDEGRGGWGFSKMIERGEAEDTRKQGWKRKRFGGDGRGRKTRRYD